MRLQKEVTCAIDFLPVPAGKPTGTVSTKGENINICWSPDGHTIAVGNKVIMITFNDYLPLAGCFWVTKTQIMSMQIVLQYMYGPFAVILIKEQLQEIDFKFRDSWMFVFWIFSSASLQQPRLPQEWVYSLSVEIVAWIDERDSTFSCFVSTLLLHVSSPCSPYSHLAFRKMYSRSLMHEHSKSSRRNNSNTRFVLVQDMLILTHTHKYPHPHA